MKALTATITVVAVLGLLAYTNPNMAMYEQYLRNTMIQQSRQEGGASEALAPLFSSLASGLLVSATTRSDYVFCSLYVTDFGDSHVEALGALNNFFVLKRANFGQGRAAGNDTPGTQ